MKMKGIIALCLKDLVVAKFGADKWAECLRNIGEDHNVPILAGSDMHDEVVLKMIQGVCTTLGISFQQAADTFGEHWVLNYSQKIYSAYYKRYTNAKDFLLAMDKVHVDMTDSIKNAHPPRFDYEWKDGRTLIMKYKSDRNLMDFAMSLAKGVGKFYKEDLVVSKLADNKMQIVFPA
jgi:hypothetical protein